MVYKATSFRCFCFPINAIGVRLSSINITRCLFYLIDGIGVSLLSFQVMFHFKLCLWNLFFRFKTLFM